MAFCTGRTDEQPNLEFLVERIHAAGRAARTWISGILGDCAEAEDLLQEAWLNMLEKIRRNEPIHHPWAYLRRVLQNLFIHHSRSILPTVDEEAISGRPDPALSALDALVEAEQEDFLLACLYRLSRRQRKALLWFYFEEKSYQEIAREMEVSVKAVERLLATGRKKLRALVKKRGGF